MALKRASARSGRVRVTFDLQAPDADVVALCGDFNDWSPAANQMKRRKDGRYSTTVTLDGERSYRFRYLVDGERWENDWEADDYVANQYGGEDSLLRLDGENAAGSPGAAATADEPALAAAPEPNEPA